MPDTARPRLGLQAIAGADALNSIDTTNDAQMDIIDANVAIDAQGTLVSRPVSTPGTPGIVGRYYYATDTGQLFRDHGTGWVEAPLVPLSDADFAASASVYATYRTIKEETSYLPASVAAADYLFSEQDLVQEGSNATLTAPRAFRLDDAFHTIAGRTPKLRLVAQAFTNTTAPATTITVGLYPVDSSAGGAGAVQLNLGAVLSGSTAAFASPGASGRFSADSTDFAFPADGWYALGVNVAGSPAANSRTLVAAQLLQHWT